MAAIGERQAQTSMPPRTPSRRTITSEKEPTPPSSDTLSSKHGAFSTDSEGETIAPPHPFLAYARRVRTFSSPLKINRARYLLTFVDAEAAQDWWKLMQQEFPDSVRESSQLFSFKSDRVPARAWENPRFAHLKDKWTYRQLEDKENEAPQEKLQNAPTRAGKRGSLMRMLSTPSLGTIGEKSQTNEVQSPANLPEDPFTEPTPPRSEQNSIDLLELNRTLDRMMMMMNQTNLRIDALAERQQTYVESLDRVQVALEANSTQIQALTTQHQAGAISTKNMRSAIEQNAGHVKTVLERQILDADRDERMDRRLDDCSRHMVGLAETQRVSHLELQQTKAIASATADRVQTILDRQHAGDEKLDAIMGALDQASSGKRPSSARSATPTPSAGGMQRLQVAIEQQSAQLAGLIKAQKTTDKTIQKMQTSFDSLSTSREESFMQRMGQMQVAHEKAMADLRRDMTTAMDERMKEAATSQTDKYDRILKALGNRTSRGNGPTVVQCNHDVAPPPRKMNKEMLGYWYKRND